MSTMQKFVAQVIEVLELDGIKDSLVGIPGQSGFSTEQRKRLTIAVELVFNLSIIFMDEPTLVVDAKAVAIVMRILNIIVATRRTTVCTIHQPSIDILEAFDELSKRHCEGRGEVFLGSPTTNLSLHSPLSPPPVRRASLQLICN
ncbi:hypothetical protein RHSIM_Rhsim06G0118600 [Rhododendron simsii]|uniref:ABC transporter domain-containing protein n=1 Tax=Rhododendron simsii TaxID=118357 RepID=A0A834GVT3_RHOSS|nr:hypothetical protein RHSIM_Rhsim06G0118600 [Rhododendron simsii]